MKVFALGILTSNESLTIVNWVEDLSDLSWLARRTVSDILKFGAVELGSTLTSDEPYFGQYKNQYKIIILSMSNHRSVVITDFEYPEDVGQRVAQRSSRIYVNSEHIDRDLTNLLTRSQIPESLNQFNQIYSDLDDVKQILLDDVEKLIERQGKLEEICDQSEYLTFQSRAFAKKARNLNSCCQIV